MGNKTNKNIIFLLFFLALFFINFVSEFLKYKTSKSLKIKYKDSIEYCKTLHIAQTGAFEACMQNYIYQKSVKDYEHLVKISDYCTQKTPTEYDRWVCIDKYFR